MHAGMQLFGALLAFVAFFAPVGCVAPRVTTQSLLSEMTDLAKLAEFPEPYFTCVQASSYDRQSVTPDDRDAWFANLDCGQFIRVEEREGRKEYVMMDAAGPGAIVRIWSANPRGMLRFYLDGAETPTFEVLMAELLGGNYPGISRPIAHELSKGWNCYFPIPYAAHCKVTGDEILVEQDGRTHRVYYHVNYRTYPAGTRVASFVPEDLKRLAPEIDRIAAALASPRNLGTESDPVHSDAASKSPSRTDANQADAQAEAISAPEVLQPGKVTQWILAARHGGAVTAFHVKLDAEDRDLALRQVLLRISFDGLETVACPVGDFFGAAPGINPYESLPLGVSKDGEMWSHWVMPFRKSCEITLANTGTQPATLRWSVATREYKWTDRTMYFNAKWRADYGVPTRPMIDWNYLTAVGRGVFAGVAFHIANPVKIWWGEGDEKIYVDGEKFPSHFGTGTEDYYGYAWCWPEPFTHAYHNQPRCDGPGNYGHTAVNRWHVLDKIPFRKDFKFDMELWHWNEEVKVDMAVVAYWYARPGGSDAFPPIDYDRLRVPDVPPYVPPRVAGALEGEELPVLEITGGTHEVQALDGLSNERHRWWHYGAPGDRLVLGFDAPTASRYRVMARFVTANDYGLFQLYVNDIKAGETRDFYNPRIKLTDEFELGVFELPAGQNKLTAEIAGKHEKAIPSYMFGLDYLRLEMIQ